jgi:peptidoglycan hydrolase-like protein with peptidoglycan-binding domain
MIYFFLTLITALSISAIAIYYSVAGLVAIFSAAAIPIIIMGGTLEISKLVTAVWLHKFWFKAKWWLRTYLAAAVVILMFITSMGIFGFLSKAHIEQTSASEESVAQEERISKEILRYEDAIRKSENTIARLEEKGTGGQAVIQTQIDKEQERIDAAYARIQPLVDEQNSIIASATQLYQTELDKIDKNLALLQSFINNGEIAKAQGMVGTKADGKYGPNTAAAFTAYQEQKSAERQEWLDKIQNASDTDTVKQAKEEIARLRAQAEKQITESNALITSYRSQLQNTEAKDVSSLLEEEQNKIKNNNTELDKLLQEKFALQADVRKLEAEVGPIKYIAEMVYGESADKDILEKAVRWVIITIIFVFDPLAVLLLIASQYTLEFIKVSRPIEAIEDKEEVEDAISDKPLEEVMIEDYTSINEKIDKIVEDEKNSKTSVNLNISNK